MNKKKTSGNQVSGPRAPVRGTEGTRWTWSSEESPSREEGSTGAREPVCHLPATSFPLCLSNPLSSLPNASRGCYGYLFAG